LQANPVRIQKFGLQSQEKRQGKWLLDAILVLKNYNIIVRTPDRFSQKQAVPVDDEKEPTQTVEDPEVADQKPVQGHESSAGPVNLTPKKRDASELHQQELVNLEREVLR